MNQVVDTLVLLVLGITLLSSSTVAQHSLPKSVDDEEYAVYSALIESYTLQHRPSSLVISETTINSPQKSLRPIRDSQVEATTRKDFLSKNDRVYALTDRLRISSKYQFSKEAERVYAAPAGMLVISLSRVGFNRKRDQAILYVRVVGERMKKQYVVLTKEDGKWGSMQVIPVLVSEGQPRLTRR